MIQIVVTSIHYFFLFLQRQDADYEYESDYPAQDESEAALGLPSDSRSIRDNIVDEFTCDGMKKMNLTKYLHFAKTKNSLNSASKSTFQILAVQLNDCMIINFICTYINKPFQADHMGITQMQPTNAKSFTFATLSSTLTVRKKCSNGASSVQMVPYLIR